MKDSLADIKYMCLKLTKVHKELLDDDKIFNHTVKHEKGLGT